MWTLTQACTRGPLVIKYRKLGAAGVKLSEIGLGSWLTYGFGVDDAAAGECIHRAFELGVNFFDTADVYHAGAAEEVLGRELSRYRRADLVIASKCYFPMSDGPNDRGLSRKHICESLHASLARLKTDYLDLYQCHRYDPEVELPEVVRAMDDLIRQGKLLYWGVSEWPADKIREAREWAFALNASPPVSNQPNYSLAQRRIEADGVRAACAEHGLGTLSFSPLAQGVLTGKYSGGKVPSDSRAADDKMNMFLKRVDRDVVDRVDQLRPIAERHNATLAQLALAWLLHQETVTSAIIGATKVAQIDDNCGAVDIELSAADLAAMDALFPVPQAEQN